jgi:hypothetical protein
MLSGVMNRQMPPPTLDQPLAGIDFQPIPALLERRGVHSEEAGNKLPHFGRSNYRPVGSRALSPN